MPKIEIDGIAVEADAGSTIIEVADRLAIPIPRFCYHRKLSVAANCRMCLVQVAKSNKALPACATPITEGMQVWTKSKEAIAAQRSVMEFLLINHPLDCPICDQGGECELQDVSLEYGAGFSRYDQPKRAVLDHNLGPLIATEMTRCIQCTRCVRFGTEIAGKRELGATGRSEFMEIGTFVEQNVTSEVSGNVIDLCPVGALTSKPFRFKARAWDLQQAPAISPHDCIGSHLLVHTYNDVVMRVVPKDAEELNEVWLSDRDRFSYEGMLHEDRLRKCWLRKQDKWHMVSWIEALKYAIAGIKLTIDTYGAAKFGTLVSPSATNEEYYLLQKFTRALGSNNIDHRLRQLDFSVQDHAPLYPNLGIDYHQLQHQDVVLLIGCDIAKEQPLAGLRMVKAVKHGSKVCSISAVDYAFNFAVHAKLTVPAGGLLQGIAGVAKALLQQTNSKVDQYVVYALGNVQPDAQQQDIAKTMIDGKHKHIILGHTALMHPQASQILAFANVIASMINGTWGYFPDGANPAGAWVTGCVPHRLPGGSGCEQAGLNAREMLEQPLHCYLLFAIEPEFDSILGTQAIETLKQADFVVAISSYQSDALLAIADVILPAALFVENEGTLVNINGSVQQLQTIIPAYGESRAGWKILRVLGSLAELSGFEYNTLADVSSEMWAQISMPQTLPVWQKLNVMPLNPAHTNLTRLAPIALYAIDGMVRRAKSLQATKDANRAATIQMSAVTAQHLNIVQDELVNVSINAQSDNVQSAKLSVQIDDRIAEHTVVIYQANGPALQLGLPFASVEVAKC